MRTSESAVIIRTADRNVWRAWLEENFLTAEEVYFEIPLKDSGETGLSYNDAVEEALCFGWIDSTIKRSDGLHRIQRFTPRRKGSPYSRPNIERLIWLDRHGMIHPSVREEVLPLIETPYEFPEDIIARLKEDEDTWRNYQGFSEPYRRIRVAYIDAARARPEEFTKRLENFVAKTRANRIITGYGGVDKYYNPHLE